MGKIRQWFQDLVKNMKGFTKKGTDVSGSVVRGMFMKASLKENVKVATATPSKIGGGQISIEDANKILETNSTQSGVESHVEEVLDANRSKHVKTAALDVVKTIRAKVRNIINQWAQEGKSLLPLLEFNEWCGTSDKANEAETATFVIENIIGEFLDVKTADGKKLVYEAREALIKEWNKHDQERKAYANDQIEIYRNQNALIKAYVEKKLAEDSKFEESREYANLQNKFNDNTKKITNIDIYYGINKLEKKDEFPVKPSGTSKQDLLTIEEQKKATINGAIENRAKAQGELNRAREEAEKKYSSEFAEAEAENYTNAKKIIEIVTRIGDKKQINRKVNWGEEEKLFDIIYPGTKGKGPKGFERLKALLVGFIPEGINNEDTNLIKGLKGWDDLNLNKDKIIAAIGNLQEEAKKQTIKNKVDNDSTVKEKQEAVNSLAATTSLSGDEINGLVESNKISPEKLKNVSDEQLREILNRVEERRATADRNLEAAKQESNVALKKLENNSNTDKLISDAREKRGEASVKNISDKVENGIFNINLDTRAEGSKLAESNVLYDEIKNRLTTEGENRSTVSTYSDRLKGNLIEQQYIDSAKLTTSLVLSWAVSGTQISGDTKMYNAVCAEISNQVKGADKNATAAGVAQKTFETANKIIFNSEKKFGKSTNKVALALQTVGACVDNIAKAIQTDNTPEAHNAAVENAKKLITGELDASTLNPEVINLIAKAKDQFRIMENEAIFIYANGAQSYCDNVNKNIKVAKIKDASENEKMGTYVSNAIAADYAKRHEDKDVSGVKLPNSIDDYKKMIERETVIKNIQDKARELNVTDDDLKFLKDNKLTTEQILSKFKKLLLETNKSRLFSRGKLAVYKHVVANNEEQAEAAANEIIEAVKEEEKLSELETTIKEEAEKQYNEKVDAARQSYNNKRVTLASMKYIMIVSRIVDGPYLNALEQQGVITKDQRKDIEALLPTKEGESLPDISAIEKIKTELGLSITEDGEDRRNELVKLLEAASESRTELDGILEDIGTDEKIEDVIDVAIESLGLDEETKKAMGLNKFVADSNETNRVKNLVKNLKGLKKQEETSNAEETPEKPKTETDAEESVNEEQKNDEQEQKTRWWQKLKRERGEKSKTDFTLAKYGTATEAAKRFVKALTAQEAIVVSVQRKINENRENKYGEPIVFNEDLKDANIEIQGRYEGSMADIKINDDAHKAGYAQATEDLGLVIMQESIQQFKTLAQELQAKNPKYKKELEALLKESDEILKSLKECFGDNAQEARKKLMEAIADGKSVAAKHLSKFFENKDGKLVFSAEFVKKINELREGINTDKVKSITIEEITLDGYNPSNGAVTENSSAAALEKVGTDLFEQIKASNEVVRNAARGYGRTKAGGGTAH